MSKIENRLVGELSLTLKGFGFVSVQNRDEDIFIAKENLNGAVDGDIVEIRFRKKKKFNSKPEAEIIHILSHNAKNVDLASIMKKYNLSADFPSAVISEAQKVANLKFEDCMDNRLDLRDTTIITIDPADARDLDDAVSLEENPDGTLTLGVHIADVSQYVTEGSELDKEAYRRGTSVYFPDRVIPMLPPQLSNGICSLNPNEPRLTLSVLMTLDKFYNIIGYKIKKTLIQTTTRFSYDEVQDILDGKKHKHRDLIMKMSEIAQKHEHERRLRGEVAFQVPEPKIVLDENGQIASVYSQPHNLSHRIIETFMIMTNEVIAEHFNKLNLPFVYRIHEKPDPLKVVRFLNTLTPFEVKHNIDFENPDGHAYQAMLDGIKDDNVRTIVSMLALRSMQKAKYDHNCVGHFGLGSTYYCHFTSPIRRYPDLLIHRIIKMFLDSKLNGPKIEQLTDFVKEASVQCSQTELDSVEAEREVDNMKRAEYMQAHLGETFEGVVNGITDFGIFVYIPANTAEGLVRIENLPADNYVFNENTMQLIGKKSKIRMGDPIVVTVIGVNLRKSKIEFSANNND